MANFAQPILRNIAQMWVILNGGQILMKMKTQVDMVNSNTKIFSFGQFCAADFACAILRKIGGYFLKLNRL